jgi:hypothetical protein
MNDTDAVSCLLCLQADEYGSMIHVCVPPGRIPPSPERVICRRCAAAIADATRESQGEEIVGSVPNTGSADSTEGRGGAVAGPGDPDWDSGLPERAEQSLFEVDRSELEAPAGSEPGAEASGLEGAELNRNANYVSSEPSPKSDTEHA